MISYVTVWCGMPIRVSAGALFTNMEFIPAWISSHMPSKVWHEIMYQLPNFNGATVEVWQWISNIIPHFIGIWLLVSVNWMPNNIWYYVGFRSVEWWINLVYIKRQTSNHWLTSLNAFSDTPKPKLSFIVLYQCGVFSNNNSLEIKKSNSTASTLKIQ